jgi:hypothetical protein
MRPMFFPSYHWNNGKQLLGLLPYKEVIRQQKGSCGGSSERLSTGQKADMKKHSGWHQQADGSSYRFSYRIPLFELYMTSMEDRN